jgi:hypothetical protein
MKKNNSIFLIPILLFISACAEKKIHLKKERTNSFHSIPLDAYESNNEKNRVKSVLSSDKSNNMRIILDGKEYESALLKSILDTINGNYSFDIDNTKKILKIKRFN